jgi:hypothetical protein
LWETKWFARLVEAAEHDLRAILHAVVEDSKFAGLKFYRNLAAHRGVIGEQQRGGEVEEVGVDGVRFMPPDWLPMEALDHPSYSVRPVLRKYLEWGRPALAGLNAVASAVWCPPSMNRRNWPSRMRCSSTSQPRSLCRWSPTCLERPRARISPHESGSGEPGSSGSHNFADGSTVPPAWYLQRYEDEPISLQAVGLQLDELRSWFEREADPLTAKAVLYHYRPETIPLNMGKLMAPRVVR